MKLAAAGSARSYWLQERVHILSTVRRLSRNDKGAHNSLPQGTTSDGRGSTQIRTRIAGTTAAAPKCWPVQRAPAGDAIVSLIVGNSLTRIDLKELCTKQHEERTTLGSSIHCSPSRQSTSASCGKGTDPASADRPTLRRGAARSHRATKATIVRHRPAMAGICSKWRSPAARRHGRSSA